MSKDDLKLHHEHGLNPSVGCCFACGKDTSVVLFGDGLKDRAPHRVFDGLCQECEDVVTSKDGVLCIEVEEDKKSHPEQKPTRTGRMFGVRREAFERVFNVPVPEKRVCYMSVEVTTRLGLDKVDVVEPCEHGDREPTANAGETRCRGCGLVLQEDPVERREREASEREDDE